MSSFTNSAHTSLNGQCLSLSHPAPLHLDTQLTFMVIALLKR